MSVGRSLCEEREDARGREELEESGGKVQQGAVYTRMKLNSLAITPNSYKKYYF